MLIVQHVKGVFCCPQCYCIGSAQLSYQSSHNFFSIKYSNILLPLEHEQFFFFWEFEHKQIDQVISMISSRPRTPHYTTADLDVKLKLQS